MLLALIELVDSRERYLHVCIHEARDADVGFRARSAGQSSLHGRDTLIVS